MSSRRKSLGGALRDGTNSRSRRASISGGALRVGAPKHNQSNNNNNLTPSKHARDNTSLWRSRQQQPVLYENEICNNLENLPMGGDDSTNKRPRYNPPQRLLPSLPRTMNATTSLSSGNRPIFNAGSTVEVDNDTSFEAEYHEPGHTSSLARNKLTVSSPFVTRKASSSSPFVARTGTSSLFSSHHATAAPSPFTSRMTNRRRSFMPLSSSSSSSSVAANKMTFLSQESENTQTFLSQDTVESDPLPISGARIQQAEATIEKLEKEKAELIKAKAPLEVKIYQQRDEFEKLENSMMKEINLLKEESVKADERCRSLQTQLESKEADVKQLELELFKAKTTLGSGDGSSSKPSAFASSSDSGTSNWNRHVDKNREVVELKQKLVATEEELKNLQLTKLSLETELRAYQIELDSLQKKHDALRDEYEKISATSSDNQDAKLSLDELTNSYHAALAEARASRTALEENKERSDAAMAETQKKHKEEVEQLQFQMDVLRNQVPQGSENVNGDDKDQENDVAVLKAHLDAKNRRILELELALAKGEEQRRHMHNRIQELRGNIRVFVRTRPFLPSDGSDTESAIDVAPDEENLEILDMRTNNKYPFTFDKIFPPSSNQEDVFKEVSDFVQSALDGYHVCLFSYGQTGSGKTHTMQGSGHAEMRGIIPRAVEQILSASRLMQTQKWTFRLNASFLEIYNEELKDLLVSFSNNKPSSSSSKNSKKLKIVRPAGCKSYVDGLTSVPIDTNNEMDGLQQLHDLMAVAARARSVAKTKMNSQSSRSHSVFMLHIQGYNEDNGAQVSGVLNLCDLAGSERLDRSGVGNDAQRLRETQNINKSLSSLGDVFAHLAKGSKHVPYRNSTLTYLLQDCLSGDGKALMFVNLSPTSASSNESLCSLRFAQRVNQVELGKATKHIEYTKKR